MPEEKTNSNLALEKSIEAASTGDEKELVNFFAALLNGPLYVPERFQPVPLTHMPQYPNDFINLLGIQQEDRVLIPAFSNPAYIEEWCGQVLNFKEYEGRRLLESVPSEWWLCINPGQEIEKDISPWEIDKLRGGSDYIKEIISELDESRIINTLEVVELESSEHPKLKAKVCEFAAANAQIGKIHLLKEKGKTLEGENVDTILLGVEMKVSSPKEMESLKEEIKNLAAREMIGAEEVRVIAGIQGSNVSLGVFKKFPPIYQRKTDSYLGKILSLVRK